MNRSRLHGAALAVIVAALAPIAAGAQGLQGPAELPPSSYGSMQYVDSRGCAFVRAGMAGNVVWVPRVNRDRSQICGQPPTFGGAAPVAAAAPVEPPRRPAEGAPIETIASLTTAPNIGATAQTATVQPAAAVPVAPVPVTLTLAQVCEGQTGILPGYRTATGAAVDCGGAPVPVATVATPVAVPAPATITLAEACAGRIGPLVGYVNAATGQPVTCGNAPRVIAAAPVAPAVAPVAEPGAQMTLAQACAGRSGPLPGYVSALTGQPVTCGPAPLPQLAAATAACPPGVVGGVAYRCGGAVYGVDPLSAATLSGAQLTRAPRQADPLHPDFWREPVPASNPVVQREVIAPPPGYAPVFDDGRLNPNRGLVARAAG